MKDETNMVSAPESLPDEALPEQPEKPKKKSRLRTVIGVIIFVAVNAAVLIYTGTLEFSQERPAFSWEMFGRYGWLFLLGGVGCIFVVLLMDTVKYLLMMRHLKARISLKYAFQVAALGKYYDYITPSGAGGQPFQIWYLYSSGYNSSTAAAMPLTSFITMQFGFVALAVFCFIFKNDAISEPAMKITAYLGAAMYAVAPIMIVLFAFKPKIVMKLVAFFIRIGAKMKIVKKPNHAIMKVVKELRGYSESLKAIGKNKLLLVLLMICSILFQIGLCSMPFFVVRAFGGNIDYFKALSMCAFIYAAITFVPTPGNSGAAEGSFYLLFSELDNTPCVFWAMLVWRILCYYSFLIIGILIYAYNAVVKLIRKRTRMTVYVQGKSK